MWRRCLWGGKGWCEGRLLRGGGIEVGPVSGSNLQKRTSSPIPERFVSTRDLKRSDDSKWVVAPICGHMLYYDLLPLDAYKCKFSPQRFSII